MESTEKTIKTQPTSTAQYKRQSKYPSEETKQKISAKLKGRCKSDVTKQRISDGLKHYWGNPNNFKDNRTETCGIV